MLSICYCVIFVMVALPKRGVMLLIPLFFTLLRFFSFEDLIGCTTGSSSSSCSLFWRSGTLELEENQATTTQETLSDRTAEDNQDRGLMQEEFDDWLLRNLPETEEVEDDEPLNKREKMWFMLKRRGWMTEVEIKRALEILRHTDEMFTDAGMDYFITDGLLLGHCRHAGFTPWDDDMDIATNRSNLEWLTSPQGLEAVAKHGLALETMWSGYHKVSLPLLHHNKHFHLHLPTETSYSWLDLTSPELGSVLGAIPSWTSSLMTSASATPPPKPLSRCNKEAILSR